MVALLWDSTCCATVVVDDRFWTLAAVCSRKQDVDTCSFCSWPPFWKGAVLSASSRLTSACSARSCRIPAESVVWVQEEGTRSLFFRTWDGPAVNRCICRGAEAITSSIPSEVLEEGGGSRIFCWSQQGGALSSSLMLGIFCSISSLYRVTVGAPSMLSSESSCAEGGIARDVVGRGVLSIAANRQGV